LDTKLQVLELDQLNIRIDLHVGATMKTTGGAEGDVLVQLY